jgi:2-keto-myo-inositol isomerase
MKPATFKFKAALNTSTLIPFELTISEQIQVCQEAGYEGIELWMRDINSYIETGKSLEDVKKQSQDSGIEILNCIAFIRWADTDTFIRSAEIEKAKKQMSILKELGCKAMAAPPFGDTKGNSVEDYAEYFTQLYRAGVDIGVEPFLEIWGHYGNIRTINKALAILGKSDIENGKVLIDPIHIHRGGGSFMDISNLSAESIGTVHVNDYPISPGINELTDTDRCFPGEGDAELNLFKEMLLKISYKKYLSLELFKTEYGNKTASDVAKYGIESIYRSF